MKTFKDETSFLCLNNENCDEEQIIHALEKDGIITFDGIESTDALLQFCTRFGTTIIHRDSDERGLTRIHKREALSSAGGYQAFTSSHLTLHTDGSSVLEPATLVVLWCSNPASMGGESLFVDGKQVYQILDQCYPSILYELKKADSAIFAGSQDVLYGSIFNVLPTGRVYIRFRYDNLVYYSASLCTVLPVFLALLNQYKLSFTLQRHQGYIIQNSRWLHGRTAFDGEREMYRILLRPHSDTSMKNRIPFGFHLEV